MVVSKLLAADSETAGFVTTSCNAYEIAFTRTGTGTFSSVSSSSSMSLNVEGCGSRHYYRSISALPIPTPVNDAEAVTHDPLGGFLWYDQQQPMGFGMAGDILLTHVFQPYIRKPTRYRAVSIQLPAHPWGTIALTTILEEDKTSEVWQDLSSIPTTTEEEAEPSGNVLLSSATHDSLLAAHSDKFESSQVTGMWTVNCSYDLIQRRFLLQFSTAFSLRVA
jgi:hypothetical protein